MRLWIAGQDRPFSASGRACAFSPAGDRLLAIRREDGRHYFVVYDLAHGQPRETGKIAAGESGASDADGPFFWPDPGNVFFAAGARREKILRLDLSSGRVVQVFPPSE